MRLFHFSDDPNISCFIPRAVVATRPAGREWLNGPLVWSIDEDHQAMYLFPRDCPRILLWSTHETSAVDVDHWLEGDSDAVLAYIERDWLEKFQTTTLYRYELPPATFEDLQDAGMWVSRTSVLPLATMQVSDLPNSLAAHGVKLKIVDSLHPLRTAWNTTLHASGIRLRNARTWQ